MKPNFFLLFLGSLFAFGTLSCLKNPNPNLQPYKTLLLPKNITESSGLALYKHSIWTHNDKGNNPSLFELDTQNGSVLQTLQLSTASESDWEDLAQNDSFLFVADVGNNKGKRTDLSITKLPIYASKNKDSQHQTIRFTYPKISKNHVDPITHDCEAVFYANNALYLITKERERKQSYVYYLPSEAGLYEAQLIDSIPTDFWITGADYCSKTEQLALLGYLKNGKCNVQIFNGVKPSSKGLRLKKLKTFVLGEFESVGQMEGIVIRNQTLIISNEKTKTAAASIRFYHIPH